MGKGCDGTLAPDPEARTATHRTWNSNRMVTGNGVYVDKVGQNMAACGTALEA